MSIDDLQIIIRQATAADAKRIAELGKQVFLQSYQYDYDPKDMDAYIEDALSAKKITEELQSETVYYYVAQMKPSELPAPKQRVARKGFIPEDIIPASGGRNNTEATDKIVGFVKFNTFMWTPRFKGKITFEVERLYIQKDMEGKSIGSRLMAKAVGVGREKQYTIIWLSVWENNTKAIGFHQRHGFEIIGDGIFALGNAGRKYLIMRLK